MLNVRNQSFNRSINQSIKTINTIRLIITKTTAEAHDEPEYNSSY